MATPKHDKCLRCGERFEALDLLFAHFYTLNGSKRVKRYTTPPPNAEHIKCLTAEEMEALGWRKWYGVWREPFHTHEKQPIKN